MGAEAGQVGDKVYIEGLSGEPYNPNQVQKKKVLQVSPARTETCER